MPVAQEDLVAEFLKRRNQLIGTNYRVTEEPDKKDSTKRAVDALAEADNAPPLAIEHTRLETFGQQIRDDHWFTRSVVPLQNLGARYGEWHISIYFLYLRGTQWAAPERIVDTVRGWLDANIDHIPEQKSGRERFEGEIPGVGIVRISKHKNSRLPGIHVGRTVPANVDFPGEGLEIMTKALGHKYDELAEYRANGYVSILLIDSRDIALTNHIEQYKAFLRSTKIDPKGGLEEIWVADVFEGAKENDIDFLCFRGPREIRKKANPGNFMLGPEYDEYWGDVLAKDDKKVGGE